MQESEFDDDPAANRAIGLTGVKAKMAMLKAPNTYLELWQYSNPEPSDLRSRPCDFGYPHIALQVVDIQEEYDRLTAHGMQFVGDVVHFGDDASAIYGRDPCGNIIELYEIKTSELAQLARPGSGSLTP